MSGNPRRVKECGILAKTCENRLTLAKADDTKALLARYRVIPLYSPRRHPQYNGGVERANGQMMGYHEALAQYHQRPAGPTYEDAEDARHAANDLARPAGWQGPTARQLWERRTRLSDQERDRFWSVVWVQRDRARGQWEFAPNVELAHYPAVTVDRRAVREAVVWEEARVYERMISVRQPPPPAVTSPSDWTWSGFFKGLLWNGPKNLVVGVYELGKGLIKLNFNLVTDPIGTAEKIWNAATRIPEIVPAIIEDFKQKLTSAEGQGEIAFDILLTLATGGLAKAEKLRWAKQLDRASDVANKLDDVGDLSKAGKAVNNLKKGKLDAAENVANAERQAANAADAVSAPRTRPKVHGNSLDYVGDTHVYAIRSSKGIYKIGESTQGVRVRDGLSIRGEAQARALRKETGEFYRSEIRKTFADKRSARDYETRLIERFRRIFGEDTLPGNKTNR